MSNGNQSDVNAQMLQMQAAIASTRNNSGGFNVFTGGLPDADVFSGLSAKGKGLNIDQMIKPAAQVAERPFEKLMKQMGINRAEIMEGFKKVAQAGPVTEASHEQLFGQGGPAGGSFVSAVTASSRGDDGNGIA